MFLAGADGTTPELRAPSIKGALRFWWRAMNGHLPIEKLKDLEGQIFGNTEKRASFAIRIWMSESTIFESVPEKPVPHKNYTIPAIQKTEFKVVISLITEKNIKIKQLQSLFELFCLLGGLGKRVRRGMGSLRILNYQLEKEPVQSYPNPMTLNDILKLINQHSPYYSISNGVIRMSYSGRMSYYGWIKQIQIGKPKIQQNVITIVSDTAHRFHQKYGFRYEPNLGHAYKGRFASPIYVSVINDDKTPIITTLNTIPDRAIGELDGFMQDSFKNNILNNE
jgi:CRISPR-associated protein Cmr1